jgi:hypothetical protein
MIIDNNKLAALRELVTWAQATAKKSATFEISFWNHNCHGYETIQYSLWIKDTFSKQTEDLDCLVSLIPHIQYLCLEAREA